MEDADQPKERHKPTKEEIKTKIDDLTKEWIVLPKEAIGSPQERTLLEDLSLQMRLAEKERMGLRFVIDKSQDLPDHPFVQKGEDHTIVKIIQRKGSPPEVTSDFYFYENKDPMGEMCYLGFKFQDPPIKFRYIVRRSKLIFIEAYEPEQ